MARGIVVVSTLALLASLTSGCLVANPAFDGADPGTTTSATSLGSSTTSAATTSATTEMLTTVEGSDAASTLEAGVTTSGTDTGTNAEAPASTGEGDDSLVLEASKTYPPKAKWYPAVLELDVPTAVLLPSTVTVTVGNAGNHTTTLTLTLADLSEVECTYKGGGSKANPKPNDPADWEKGLGYFFTACADGAVAGDMRTVVKLQLNINNGASMQPPAGPRTTVVAVVPKA